MLLVCCSGWTLVGLASKGRFLFQIKEIAVHFLLRLRQSFVLSKGDRHNGMQHFSGLMNKHLHSMSVTLDVFKVLQCCAGCRPS
jgi:hypothetical protein